MTNYVQNIYQQMLDELSKVPEARNLSVKNPSAVGELVRKTTAVLKDHFTAHPFWDQNEEVQFFKYEKPVFQAEYIYALELYMIESNRPHGGSKTIGNYYGRELHIIRRFFDQFRFIYQYYQLDGVDLDNLYFCRNGARYEITVEIPPDYDPEFSTPASFLFAKFIALERLQDYLITLLYKPASSSQTPGPDFRWTGDKVNLVELAYGLYDSAQIGDGQTSIAEIIGWLEQSFSLKLPRYFQMFSEIRGRKSVSKSRFLDHMAKMVNQHINEGNEFKPQIPKPVSGSRSAGKV